MQHPPRNQFNSLDNWTVVTLKNYNSSIVFLKFHLILPFFFVSNTVSVSIVSWLVASTSDASSDSSCCAGSSPGVGLWSGSSSDAWWGSSAKGMVSCAENKATNYFTFLQALKRVKIPSIAELQFNGIDLSLTEKRITKDMLVTPDVKHDEPDAREDFVWY